MKFSFFFAEPCELDCPHGFRRDLLGQEVCACAADDDPVSTTSSQSAAAATQPAPPTCRPLIGCTKECLYGYRRDRYGCARCRCNRCPTFSCAKKCRDGFAYSTDGCRLCRCLGQFSCTGLTRNLLRGGVGEYTSGPGDGSLSPHRVQALDSRGRAPVRVRGRRWRHVEYLSDENGIGGKKAYKCLQMFCVY